MVFLLLPLLPRDALLLVPLLSLLEAHEDQLEEGLVTSSDSAFRVSAPVMVLKLVGCNLQDFGLQEPKTCVNELEGECYHYTLDNIVSLNLDHFVKKGK